MVSIYQSNSPYYGGLNEGTLIHINEVKGRGVSILPTYLYVILEMNQETNFSIVHIPDPLFLISLFLNFSNVIQHCLSYSNGNYYKFFYIVYLFNDKLREDFHNKINLKNIDNKG